MSKTGPSELTFQSVSAKQDGTSTMNSSATISIHGRKNSAPIPFDPKYVRTRAMASSLPVPRRCNVGLEDDEDDILNGVDVDVDVDGIFAWSVAPTSTLLQKREKPAKPLADSAPAEIQAIPAASQSSAKVSENEGEEDDVVFAFDEDGTKGNKAQQDDDEPKDNKVQTDAIINAFNLFKFTPNPEDPRLIFGTSPPDENKARIRKGFRKGYGYE